MRSVVALLMLLLASAAAWAADEACGICHGAERVQHEASVHRTADLGCVDCHGGDPSVVDRKEAAHAADKGYRGKISRHDLPQACGGCHADVTRMRPFGLRTDALAAWKTSHHGKALLEKGTADSATCTDCHGVHDVLRVRDPQSPAYRRNVPATCGKCHGDAEVMKRHDLPFDPPEEFAQSIHGIRLAQGMHGVPSCADCHDAHAATPPGATEVADVCGNCHRETRERFRESAHFAASGQGAMKQCITCHDHHDVDGPGFAMFDATEDSHEGGARCLSCHDGENAADEGAKVAIGFGRGFRAADLRIREANEQIERAAATGYYVDDERETLDRARRALTRTVPLTHTLDLHRVEAELGRVQSLVDESLSGYEGKMREARDRRIFGTGAAVVLFGISGLLALRRRRTFQS